MIHLRQILFVCAILSALYMPPWITLVCIAVAVIRYPASEMLLVAAMTDLLYAPHGTLPYMLLATICLLWGCAPIRTELAA
jgi:hypothetical protein